jgi:hypothetical protein
MSWVVCWKPPWPLHARQGISCVQVTALQEFLTCIMVISVGIVAAELIQGMFGCGSIRAWIHSRSSQKYVFS